MERVVFTLLQGSFLLFWPLSGLGKGSVKELLDKNQIKEAVKICKQHEVLSGTNRETYMDCARVFLNDNRLESARKMMDGLKMDPSKPEHQLLEALYLVKSEKYDKASLIFDALEKKHKSGNVGFQLQEMKALMYEAKGSLDAAAFIYKQLVGDHPEFAPAQWGLARYYLSQSDLVRAKSHLEKTAKLWPKHLSSRYNLAVLALKEDRLGEAASWLAESYRIEKNDPEVLEALGILFEKKGNIEVAIKHWRKAIAINPKSTISKEKLARYFTTILDQLIDAKQYGEALRQIMTSGPMEQTAEMSLRRGIIYRNQGKFDKALSELLIYEKTDSRNTMVYRELGICYFNLKIDDKALENLSRAIALEPSNGINYAWLGKVFEELKDYEKARDSFKQAMELLKDPKELAGAARKLASIQGKIDKMKEKNKKD